MGKKAAGPKYTLATAAFVIESVAHMRAMERELLPLAEFIRELNDQVEKWLDESNDEKSAVILHDIRTMLMTGEML